MNNIENAFVASAIQELLRVRRHAGLTQQQLAERLGTTQSAIARLENSASGTFSTHRYVDYALACGFVPVTFSLVPFEFHLIPLQDAIDFRCEHSADARMTWSDYVRWKAWRDVETLPQRCIASNSFNSGERRLAV